MSRLTLEQIEEIKNTYDTYYSTIETNVMDKICDELVKYKSVEEELGCSLDIFWKICKGTHIEFLNKRTNKIEDRELYLLDDFISFKNKKFTLIDYDYDDDYGGDIVTLEFDFVDYGKTWWLKGE